MRIVVSILAFVAVVLSSTLLSAEVILPNLPPGSQYQLVFVTSGSHDASSNSIGIYNTFVTQQAALNPLLPGGIAWQAIASTSSIDAINNAQTDPSIPIYNTHGDRVANGRNDLWLAGNHMLFTGRRALPLNYDQYGNLAPVQPDRPWAGEWVWTGSDESGHGVWGAWLGGPDAGSGYVYGSTLGNEAGYQGGVNSYPLFALSTPITVATPEPSTIALLGIGAISLLAYAWRRQKRTASFGLPFSRTIQAESGGLCRVANRTTKRPGGRPWETPSP